MSDIAAAALRGERTQRREVRVRGDLTLIVSAGPVTLSGKSVAECVIVARDITELRRLETVRRDFVANVSHELRTPLASIRAMTETLQDGALSDHEVAGRFLETIVGESDRLTRIAQDLLILSTAESETPLSLPVNLSEILKVSLEQMSPAANKAGISIQGRVEENLHPPLTAEHPDAHVGRVPEDRPDGAAAPRPHRVLPVREQLGAVRRR